MTSLGLRTEDRLDGAANFVSWKAQILLVLKENELWEEVVRNTTSNPITIPPSTNAALLAAFNKKDIKSMRIILDVVKDHVIPHISAKDHAHEMWSTLTGLFESTNENRKMVLRENLKTSRWSKERLFPFAINATSSSSPLLVEPLHCKKPMRVSS